MFISFKERFEQTIYLQSEESEKVHEMQLRSESLVS